MIISSVRNAINDAVKTVPTTTAEQLLEGLNEHPLLMSWKWPVYGVILYLLSKDLLKLICHKLKTNGKSSTFKKIALFHNIGICLFSLTASYSTWSITLSHVKQHGYENVLCDSTAWHDGLNYWSFIFYLSKYWELFDSYLLVWKQRSPSFLQVYHHAMTIICAYMLHSSHSPVVFVFIGFNATVHTIMYAYYAATVLGFRMKTKFLITVLQIVQFIVGNAIAISCFFIREGKCINQSQQVAITSIVTHAFILIALFVNFFRQTYLSKQRNSKQKHI